MIRPLPVAPSVGNKHRKIPTPCIKCGGVKEPGPGKRVCAKCRPLTNPTPCVKCGSQEGKRPRKRYCDDCFELMHWHTNCVRRLNHRKACARCGGPKGAGKRMKLCAKCRATRAFPPPRVCAGCGIPNITKKFKRLCDACHVVAARRETRRKREWHLAHPRTGRLKVVPLTWADDAVIPRVPAWPLAEAIDSLGSSESIVRARLDLAERTLYRWRVGEADRIQFDVADRIITASPWLWFDVWNERTLRTPALVVTRHRLRRLKGRTALIRVATTRYGDLGPAREELAGVAFAFTGDRQASRLAA